MPRWATQWLVATSALSALLAAFAYWQDEPLAWKGLFAGVLVSLVTLLATRWSLAASRWSNKPLHRMLLETCIRVAMPMGFVLAMAVARRDLLEQTFLLYFLPFQILTIVVGVADAIRHVGQSP
ncbi:hypothetical protein [Aeoliella sp.]|uniref:hypothetical protein n=1 Tax=Aeoliella sp. TaxID=2795800 RepID=UPI003CCBCC6A